MQGLFLLGLNSRPLYFLLPSKVYCPLCLLGTSNVKFEMAAEGPALVVPGEPGYQGWLSSTEPRKTQLAFDSAVCVLLWGFVPLDACGISSLFSGMCGAALLLIVRCSPRAN